MSRPRKVASPVVRRVSLGIGDQRQLFPAVTAALAVMVLAGCETGQTDLTIWLEATREEPWAPVLVVAVFVASGFVIAPLSAVMVPTIFAFGPLEGSLWTLLGATVSGVLFFHLGATGSAVAARLGSRELAVADRLKHALTRLGVPAIACIILASVVCARLAAHMLHRSGPTKKQPDV